MSDVWDEKASDIVHEALPDTVPAVFVSGAEVLIAQALRDAYAQGQADERAKARVYEDELESAAYTLSKILPIGQVKAIGLLEVAAGLRQHYDWLVAQGYIAGRSDNQLPPGTSGQCTVTVKEFADANG